MDYHRRYGVAVKIIRIFNTYGPRMACDDGRVVSNFILQALQGKDLTIYGNGMQTRSFQYVDDLIRGMERMMSTPDNFTGPVNLGNPEEHTILEFAQQIIELTGSRSRWYSVLSRQTTRNGAIRTSHWHGRHWIGIPGYPSVRDCNRPLLTIVTFWPKLITKYLPTMNKHVPSISVCMVTYNASPFLRDCLDSILSQTFTDYELLIVDDGSTDDTVDIIRSYPDGRIRLIRHLHDYIASLNLLYNNAIGKYIARNGCMT